MAELSDLTDHAWACGEHIGLGRASESVMAWALEAARKRQLERCKILEETAVRLKQMADEQGEYVEKLKAKKGE